MIKNIFLYWAQGFENAPEVVQKCLSSWKMRNPTWTIHELDDSNISNYITVSIQNINKKNISKTGYSDIVRIHLLEKYGGCWCDATTFCNIPLDEWLPDKISSGFFAFARSDMGPNIKTSSWFLYGDLNNHIITSWKKHTISFWEKNSESKQYFWFHNAFADLYRTDAHFKDIWDSTEKMSAGPPHFLQARGLLNAVTENVKTHIQNKQTPIYKLTYKFNKSKLNDNCNLSYLLKFG
jgi:hypothetical protein